MRAKHFWPLLVLVAVATGNRAMAQSAMRWQSNLETAKRLAAQTNRLVLVHFWRESCGPCMKMEREVFSRPEVAAAIESNFVPVRVNAQRQPQIAGEFGVTALPTDVILDPKGGIIDRKTGGSDAGQYVAALNQIAARARGTPNQAALAQAAPNPAFGSPAYRQPPVASAPQAGTPSGAAPGYRGALQANSASYDPSAAAPPRQLRTQPWQPETGQWNPGGSGAANYAPAGTPVPTSTSMNRPVGLEQSTNMGGQPWAAPSPPRGDAAGARSGMAPSRPPVSDAPPANPPLGLDGYCPVEVLEKERWVRGDPRYGVIHRGRTYLFRGPAEANRFYADPDRYAPVLSGIDVVVAVEENRQVPGKREYGAWYGGRMYLFSSETSFRKFDQDPGRYAAAAAQVAQASARRPAARSEPSPFDRHQMR